MLHVLSKQGGASNPAGGLVAAKTFMPGILRTEKGTQTLQPCPCDWKVPTKGHAKLSSRCKAQS